MFLVLFCNTCTDPKLPEGPLPVPGVSRGVSRCWGGAVPAGPLSPLRSQGSSLSLLSVLPGWQLSPDPLSLPSEGRWVNAQRFSLHQLLQAARAPLPPPHPPPARGGADPRPRLPRPSREQTGSVNAHRGAFIPVGPPPHPPPVPPGPSMAGLCPAGAGAGAEQDGKTRHVLPMALGTTPWHRGHPHGIGDPSKVLGTSHGIADPPVASGKPASGILPGVRDTPCHQGHPHGFGDTPWHRGHSMALGIPPRYWRPPHGIGDPQPCPLRGSGMETAAHPVPWRLR